MNYDEAIRYLYDIPRFSKKTTRQNTLKILELLGNPQESMKFFHIAGSNGKGSVCAFLNSVLVNSGFPTGMFTSPHLIKPNERIRIDDISLSDDEFLLEFMEVYDVIKTNEKLGVVHPSFFEYLFLMAMTAFKRANVRYAVIEVGLGGRLDATNVIKEPLVSVITSISLEHTEILGDTIEKIAWEKAGIIKQNVPVVFDASDKAAGAVIMKKASEMNAELYPVQSENIKIIKKEDKYIDFSLNTRYYDNDMLRIPFPAFYQTINSSLAYIAIELAKKRDSILSTVTEEEIRKAFGITRWEGRMECTDGNIYIDGAHNIAGIDKFLDAVNDIEVKGDKYLLFSVVKDKNYEQMILMLTQREIWKHIYISAVQIERTTDTKVLRRIFEECGAKEVSEFQNAGEALECALETMGRQDALFCAGSLYLAGEIKKHIQSKDIRKEEKYD